MAPSMEIPERVRPVGDNGYFEQLTKAIFQAGFSWSVIRQKWPNSLPDTFLAEQQITRETDVNVDR